eukprot:gene506-900_t
MPPAFDSNDLNKHVIFPWRKVVPLADEVVRFNEFKRQIDEKGIVVPVTLVSAGDYEGTLLRFLRARQLVTAKALKMLEDTLAFRAQEKVDLLLLKPVAPEAVANIRKHQACSHLGVDLEGHPLFLDRPGYTDIDGMLSSGVKEDDVMTYHLQELEWFANYYTWVRSEQCGHTVDKKTVVVDGAKTSVSLFMKIRTLFSRISTVDQANYPENVNKIVIMNAGWFFSGVFRLITPLLDVHTREKIAILNSSRSDFDALHAVVAPSHLPKVFQGEMKDEDSFTVCGDTQLAHFYAEYDCEIRRKQQLVEEGATMAEAMLPTFVRTAALNGTLQVCEPSEAASSPFASCPGLMAGVIATLSRRDQMQKNVLDLMKV